MEIIRHWNLKNTLYDLSQSTYILWKDPSAKLETCGWSQLEFYPHLFLEKNLYE